ncbi:MAG: ABC transporter ATP-binding protein [Actinomycetota bacterium]
MSLATVIDPSTEASPSGGDEVLVLDEVSKHYPTTPPVVALDSVSLTITRGELVAIVGASGSGKSTLLNIVGTLDRPTAGRVLIEGTATTDLSDTGLAGLRSNRIGFVFQQFHLLEQVPAIENVATGLLYRGVSGRTRRRLAREALVRVGLEHRINHLPSKLSGGERQRVAIARAIVGEPAIVLADEPTGNLDSRTSEDIVALLRRLHREGSTIVVITHDRELAESLPRRVTIRDGRIVGDERVTTAGAAAS